MPAWLIVTLAALGALGTLTLVWRQLRRLGRDIQVERARELFRLQRERLEAAFLRAAQASGRPRGLRWVDCAFDSEVAYARDRQSGQLAALVGVTIRFEAIEGSDMEGLPAVANLRSGSAVFYFQRGHWLTAGRAIFNLSPTDTITHFRNQYEAVPAHETERRQP